MSARDQAEISGFIERFAQVCVDAGMPRIASRIFIALTVSDTGRLTAAELAEQLHASAGAISGGVRYLIQVDLVRRERERGARRDTYVVDKYFWERTIGQRDQFLNRWIAYLREGTDLLGANTPAGERYAESVEFFEFMNKELQRSMESWRRYRAERDAATR